jgi:hypothetical protein
MVVIAELSKFDAPLREKKVETATGAARARPSKRDSRAATAHPAHYASGISNRERMCWHIPRDNCAGSYESELVNRDAAKHDGSCPDRCSALNQRWQLPAISLIP